MLAFTLICFTGFAEKRWIGGNAGNWNLVSNWQPAGIPGSSDTVVLNNDLNTSSYSVTLPDHAVSIHSLVIDPAEGLTIQFILPASNLSSPALLINRTGNGIIIKKGGAFRNSSGLGSGQSIQINGMLCIYNGGSYVHNTRSSHAIEIVAKLSTAAGTEKGSFEFDVPGGSYPISLSNRTYGTLILSSNASGGSQTYNASGTNPVVVNGDFCINDGVQFNADLAKALYIHGDYMQNGGVFNMASQPNNNPVIIMGNLTQASPGIITETSSGLPVIELAGVVNQQASLAGAIINSIAFKINNANGVTLLKPLLLGFKLELTRGKLKTTATSLLMLSDNTIVEGGSSVSFVEGPMRKKGDDDFEFPVGKQGDYAPVKITGAGAASDEFQVEYFLANATTRFGDVVNDHSMVRISTLEYWVIEKLSGSSLKKVGLTVGTYSNATALDKIVVARWDPAVSMWKNEGNYSYQGVATGIVQSNIVAGFGVFTLASTTENQNPLSVSPSENRIHLHAEGINGKQSLSGELSIYPTVVKDHAVIKFHLTKAQTVTVVIIDLHGRILTRINRHLRVGINSVNLNLDHLTAGAYFVQLHSNERNKTVHFFKY